MSDTRNQIAAALFEPVPGGYVYRRPYRWGFGPDLYYEVNDAQKAAIVAIVIADRPVLMQIWLWIAFSLMVVAASIAVWAYTGHDSPHVLDILAMIALTMIEVVIALQIFRLLQLHRLRPILDALPRTEQRLTTEYRQRIAAENAKAVSPKQMMVTCLTSAIASTVFSMSFVVALALGQFSGVFNLFPAAVFGFVSLVYFRRLMDKIDQQ